MLTYHTGNNSNIRPLIPERLLISNSILNYYNGSFIFLDSRGDRFNRGVLINSFVGTNNEIESLLCLCRRFQNFLRNYSVLSVIL